MLFNSMLRHSFRPCQQNCQQTVFEFETLGNAFTLISEFSLLSQLLYLFSLVVSTPVHLSICTRKKNENIWPKCPSVAKHSPLTTAFPLTVFLSTVFIFVFFSAVVVIFLTLEWRKNNARVSSSFPTHFCFHFPFNVFLKKRVNEWIYCRMQ